jgi:single-stranded DNA-binding protein
MSKQYSKTVFVGHPGGDPEMRQTPAGMPMTTFNFAANDQCTSEWGGTIKITA